MLTREWIFPDQTRRIVPKGESFFKAFVGYLEDLEDTRPEKYYSILSEVEDVMFKPKKLVQYAITHLGCIMVGEYDMKVVACAGFNQHSQIIKEYEKEGWTVHVYDYGGNDDAE